MPLDHLDETVPQKEKWRSSNAIADSDRNAFDCNICLECVQDPVVTLCGHLYCWPCIYKWLQFQSTSLEIEEQNMPQCPVCKSEVSQSSLIPLYGRGQSAIPSSEAKAHQVGIVVPQRPQGPRSYTYNTTPVSQPISQSYHPYNPYHPQQFHSTPNGYTSPMLSTSGSLDNFGMFGEMIYARVFGNHIHSYPNSYNLSGVSNNPRMRRHLMQIDKSLSRISFFLLCCLVLCLLLF